MSWALGFANEIRQNSNTSKNHGISGVVVGKIIGINPLKISTSNGSIILDETIHELYICNQLLATYKRKFKGDGNLRFKDNDCGITTLDGGCSTAGPHTHNVQEINVKTNFEFDGDILFIDTLVVGDEVMLSPDVTGQVFFIVDKIKKLGSD